MHPFLQYDYKYGTNYYNLLIKEKKDCDLNVKNPKRIAQIFPIEKNDYGFYIEERIKKDSYNIFIGNPEKEDHECVNIRIDNEFPDIANLIFFHNEEKSNINRMLEKGEGTKIMFNIIKDYIKKFHKNVKMIDLSDTAKIECCPTGKECYYNNYLTKFKLYKWYLFLYEEGYYQKNYGFDFVNKFKKEKHIENVRKVKTLRVNIGEVYSILKKLEITNKEILDLLTELKKNELWSVAIKRIRDKNLFGDYCYILDNLLSEIMLNNKIYDLYDEDYRLYL